MIIYGTKLNHLKTVDISLACSNYGHDQRVIHVYRNFFNIFYIPVLPLTKKAIVNCPNCKKEQTKKEFLKEFGSKKDSAAINEQLKSMIKEARVPLYTYATTALAFILIFGFMSWVYYENRQSSLLAASYAQEPKDNVLAVVRNESEAYQYDIMYISHIQDQEAIIFQWKYSYASLKDAQLDIFTVRNSISENQVNKNFLEPTIVSLEAFHEANFVYILPLAIAAVDLEQFQEQDES